MWEQLLVSVETDVRAPATDATIAEFNRGFGRKLPADYEQFVRAMNGGEGWIGDAYACLWKVEELIPSNKDYGVDDSVPGLLLFGTNGANEAFAFDTRDDPWSVVVVPLILLQYEDAVPAGVSFTEFVERLRRFGTCLP
jgi:hypothetical protein